MLDPGLVRILEVIQNASRALNTILNRPEATALPFATWHWTPVDPSPDKDTGESFGYSKHSIRRDRLRAAADNALEREIRALQDEDAGDGADARALVGSGLNRRGTTEEDDARRKKALKVARLKRVMRESRRPDGSRSGISNHPRPSDHFITSVKDALEKHGLEVRNDMSQPIPTNNLFHILAVFNSGSGDAGAVREVRKAVADHMAVCTKCQSFALRDEAVIYGERAPHTGTRAEIMDKHRR